jgi:hypothetical protein
LFLSVKVLSRVFRGKFLAGLKCLYRGKKLLCVSPSAALADPQQFAQLLRRLHRQDWVVYAKPAFGGPMQVLRYLGLYAHRVAISNHRLLAFDGEYVTFRWKDYARGGKQGQMKLRACEFLRRLLLHVLPKAFVRIRHFGFLANRFRASRQLLAPLSCTVATETSPHREAGWSARVRLIRLKVAAGGYGGCGLTADPHLTAMEFNLFRLQSSDFAGLTKIREERKPQLKAPPCGNDVLSKAREASAAPAATF